MRQLTQTEIAEIKLAIAWLGLPEIEIERQKKEQANRKRYHGGAGEKKLELLAERRKLIAAMWTPEMSVAEIARATGCNKSTVSNDLDALGLRKRLRKLNP